MKNTLLTILLACTMISPALSQTISSVQADTTYKYEFRGAWIATVVNLDWPNEQGQTTAKSKEQLEDMMDGLHQSGINAVMFQVRSEADALYASNYEPWSIYLSGEQGTAPSPYFDPLEYAIELAHERGMELHAWFNPYRADRNINSTYTRDPNHVTIAHPEWILTKNTIKILDPGQPVVRNYVRNVIMDVVNNYDIDGVHFDDYFYPYPPNHFGNADDQATFDEFKGDFTDRGKWRRNNVNLLVSSIMDSINVVKPTVKFGISPFGIWKNGVPSGTNGLDAYNVIYCDGVTWLNEGTVDYISPQLYWKHGGLQDFAKLSQWWADQSVAGGRHVYPGIGTYRSSSATFSGTLFNANEIPRQIRRTRDLEHMQGQIHFRAKNITRYSSKGIADSLQTYINATAALQPKMFWKFEDAPAGVSTISSTMMSDTEIKLDWETATDEGATPTKYAIYRVNLENAPVADDLAAIMSNGANLIAVTGDTTYTDNAVPAENPYYYIVTGVNHNSDESAPSDIVAFTALGVANEPTEKPVEFTLDQNYPNPFNPTTTISFTLNAPARVSLSVYDLLGRRVAILLDNSVETAGTHDFNWTAQAMNGSQLASGVYLYVLEAGESRISKKMVLLR